MTKDTSTGPKTRLSRLEIIILAGLFLLLVVLSFGGAPRPSEDGKITYAIYQGNRLLLRFDASRPYGDFRLEGLPTIVFRYSAEGLSIIENDCPDQLCVHHAPISEPGEQILCVPHQILCRVESDDSEIDVVLGG